MKFNRSMPRATVIPTMPYPDIGAAVDWLQAAFGFTLRLRIGDHRAQMNVGDDGAVVLIVGEGCDAVMVRVADVDAHYARAVSAGAEILGGPPATYPYGERQYSAIDPGGHLWTFSETVADVDPAAWGGAPDDLR